MAAKRTMEPAFMDGPSSNWHAVVPGPGSDALHDKVKANLDQLCEGTGIEVMAYCQNYDFFPKWYLDFKVAKAV